MIEPVGAAVLAEARRWLGTPYMHQASCLQAGCDCLGLLRGIWRALRGPEPGFAGDYTADWAEASGQERLLSAARSWLVVRPLGQAALGDVVLFRMRADGVAKHLGIQSALGPEPRFIHAYSGHSVTESPLSQPWARRIAGRFSFPQSAG